MKKGNWVEFKTREGKTIQGFVAKGGKTIVVHFDITDTSYRSAKGHPSMFKLIDTPVLDESNITDDYEVKAYKQAGGEETPRFEASLYHKGKKVAIVSNDGHGGCNNYYPIGGNTHDVITEFQLMAREWVNYYKYKVIEPEDLCFEWLHEKTTNGCSSKQYLSN